MNTFIEHFAEQFDETEPKTFTAETVFKELDEWSSMTALTVIAMVDDEYDVTISGDDIRNAETVHDLYQRVIELKS